MYRLNPLSAQALKPRFQNTFIRRPFSNLSSNSSTAAPAPSTSTPVPEPPTTTPPHQFIIETNSSRPETPFRSSGYDYDQRAAYSKDIEKYGSAMLSMNAFHGLLACLVIGGIVGAAGFTR